MTADFRVFSNPFIGPFVEGFREALDISTGGRITMTPQATTSLLEPIDFAISRPEEWPNTIFPLGEDNIMLMGIDERVFGGKILEPRPQGLTGLFPAGCMTFFTLDQSLNSIHDLAGKRVHMGPVGHEWGLIGEKLFEVIGLADSIDFVSGGKEGIDALADREVDVFVNGVVAMDSLQATQLPNFNQLALLTGTMASLDIPEAAIQQVRDATPEWVDAGLLNIGIAKKGGMRGPAGVDYAIVREDGHCIGSGSFVFWVGPAEEQVVYETMAAILDNRDIADNYFPFIAGLWKERLGHFWIPQANFHPGAARAYEETGVTYGVEGINEWLAGQN